METCHPVSMKMAFSNPDAFRTLVDDAARQLSTTVHRVDGSFIRTSLLYPSGATVVVRIDDHQGRYFVSDMGYGHQEAEMMGASNFFARHARSIAEAAGVKFDNHAFFILEASREELPGAVVTIANCSQEATIVSAFRLVDKKASDNAQEIYDRLVSIFKADHVERNVEIVGSSNRPWPFAAVVRANGGGRPTIFESVNNHHSSIAHATMKLNDVKLLDVPPNRVAIVKNKSEFGTFLSVLSQTANVVEMSVSDDTIRRLSKTA